MGALPTKASRQFRGTAGRRSDRDECWQATAQLTAK